MGLKAFVAVAVISSLAALALIPNHVGFTYVGASPLNPGWDGTTSLVALLKHVFRKVDVITSWAGVKLPKPPPGACGVVFVVSPTRPLSAGEVRAVADAVSEGYALVIADEGLYSNALLKAVGAPIRIVGDVVTVNGSPAVTTVFRAGSTTLPLRLFYASHLRVWDGAKVLAYAGGGPVAAEYGLGRSTDVVVVGDGTPLINDALLSLRRVNPYVRFARALISLACGGRAPRYAVVDGAPYALKPASLAALLKEGYPLPYVAASLLNPYRYYFGVRSLAEEVPTQLKPLLAAAAALATLTTVSALAGRLMAGMPKGYFPRGRAPPRGGGLTYVGVKVVREACREGAFASLARDVCSAVGRVKAERLDAMLRPLLSDPRVREALLRAARSLRGAYGA